METLMRSNPFSLTPLLTPGPAVPSRAQTYTIVDFPGSADTNATCTNTGGTTTGYYDIRGSAPSGFIRDPAGAITYFDSPKRAGIVATKTLSINLEETSPVSISPNAETTLALAPLSAAPTGPSSFSPHPAPCTLTPRTSTPLASSPATASTRPTSSTAFSEPPDPPCACPLPRRLEPAFPY